MAEYIIKKGLDLPVAGSADPVVQDALSARSVSFFPARIPGIKPKLAVKEGDVVKRGGMLFTCKKTPDICFCSPAGGTVREIILGERRMVEEIRIDVAEDEPSESFDHFSMDQLKSAARDDLLKRLLQTGYLALMRQRPFSRLPDPAVMPKAVFINAMQEEPLDLQFEVELKGQETAFQAGLWAVTRLTEGAVHLCVPASASGRYMNFEGAELHVFRGPHPAGRSSIHIHNIDPIKPGDKVWTVHASDLLLIGRLLLEGELPADRVVALGGPAVKPDFQKHYRVRIGTRISDIAADATEPGDLRFIAGGVLTGDAASAEGYLPQQARALAVLPEVDERRFLGWLDPGFKMFSASRAFVSRWLPQKAHTFNTDTNGSLRALVATGLYEKYFPMNVMVDFLIWAVYAHDTDEAIKLGILETEPEDFAICSYVCPSKLDIVAMMREGLEEIEAEGIL